MYRNIFGDGVLWLLRLHSSHVPLLNLAMIKNLEMTQPSFRSNSTSSVFSFGPLVAKTIIRLARNLVRSSDLGVYLYNVSGK
jgi:hypothetical protein